jgi:hypothetical protein
MQSAFEQYEGPEPKVADWHNDFNVTAELLKVHSVVLLLWDRGPYDQIIYDALVALDQEDGAGRLNYVMRAHRDQIRQHINNLRFARQDKVNYWNAVQLALSTFATNLAALGNKEISVQN